MKRLCWLLPLAILAACPTTSEGGGTGNGGNAGASQNASSAAASSSSGASSGGSSGTSSSGSACAFEALGADDKERVVVVSNPYTASGGNGTSIHTLTLGTTGLPVDTTNRLDVGVRPARMEFVPSGELLLVLGEDGDLVSVAVNGAASLTIVDQVTLPSADYPNLRLTANGRTAYVVGFNSVETGGISTVHIACDGTLTVDEAAFLPLRLVGDMVLLPGETRAIVLGGQAVFDPIDNNELRLFNVGTGGFTSIMNFDLWSDSLDFQRMAISPAGDLLVIPNGSAFSSEGSEIRAFSIAGDVITQTDRIQNVSSADEAMFSWDGNTILVSRFEANAVMIYTRNGDQLQSHGQISGIGLASHMAQITRGGRQGLVLLPSTDASGAHPNNVSALQITGAGQVTDLGQVTLGDGYDDIPGTLAVQP